MIKEEVLRWKRRGSYVEERKSSRSSSLLKRAMT